MRATSVMKETGGRTGGVPRLAALAALMLAASACSDTSGLRGGCTNDEDCGDPLLFRCDWETAECRCRADGACDQDKGEYCNRQGYCQVLVGCYETRDCPDGYFCDASTNSCLADGRCAADVHCQAGELCDRATNVCKPGCRSNGDCGLRQVCLCAGAEGGEAPCGCDATSEAERERCAVGRCTAETCLDQSYCGWGETCREPPEGGPPRCESDYDPVLRPYCDPCNWGPGQEACGSGPNFCLYSTYSGTNYCGADCSQGQTCPNGYDCGDVIVVYTSTKCNTNADCATPERRTDIPCDADEDCPLNGLCGKDPGAASGFCHGRCNPREGAKESFCACVANEDCAQDSCDPLTRTCSITRQPCDLGGAGCPPIRCVEFGEQGGCFIGQNCKPLTGLTCGDMAGE